MPASDESDEQRLAELLQHRDALARQLAWFDREIDRASQNPRLRILPQNVSPPAPFTSAPTSPQPFTNTLDAVVRADLPFTPAPVELAPPAELEALLAKPASGLNPREKWGCVTLALVVIFLIVALLFGLPYLLYR
jgi:hypothetical protein